MKHKLSQKLLSMIMALVMVLTCLAMPAAANQTSDTISEPVEAGNGTVLTDTAVDEEQNQEVTIMVLLEGETAYMQTSDLQVATAAYDRQMAAQIKTETQIERTLDESIEVEDRYSLFFNGFSFTGESWMIDAINEMDGVTAFEAPVFELIEAEASEETDLTPSMSLSTGLTNTTSAWELGYTGKGMVVAVIDSGIRQTHQAFSVMPENAKIDKAYLEDVISKYGDKIHFGKDANALYYNAKLPFSWDYYDGDAYPNHTASDHGTHVAGIAAGNNGADFKGVAPDAQIVTMQVFTSAGGASFSTLMAAMEDCVYLGVDVINMSLGLTAWFSSYDSIAGMEDVYTALENAGITVCAAAGNDTHVNMWTNFGYGSAWFAWNPDAGAIGAPATFDGSFSVASVVNRDVNSGTAYFTAYGKDYYPVAEASNPTFFELENKDYEIVNVGLGSPEEIEAAGGLEGKIALVQRGVSTFTDKCVNAKNAGAVACIIYNNVSGPLYPYVESPIPFGSFSLEEGEDLIAKFPDGVHGTISMHIVKMTYKDVTMASTSSWGTTAALEIKPEIAAPGDGITSSIGFGDDASYATWSGTSMATPHIAGGMMLIKQRLREVFTDKTDVEINKLAYAFMMNTAHQVNGMVRQAGAGLMDLKGALTTEAYVTVPGADRPKLELDDSEDGKFTFSFEVTNFGQNEKTYTIAPSILTEEVVDKVYSGYRENTEYESESSAYREYNSKNDYFLSNPTAITAKVMNGTIKDVTDLCDVTAPETVTVKAGETVTVNMTIQCGEELMKYFKDNCPAGMYLEGYIVLKDQAENGVDLSMPFLGFVGDWDYAPMFDLGFWWNTPYGVNNLAQMRVTQGTYIGSGVREQGLGLNYYADMTGETYLADRNAISPNGDGRLDSVNYAEFSMMRNPKTVKLYVTDEEGNVVQTLHESSYNYRKDYYYNAVVNAYATYSSLAFEYAANELEENETAYIVLEAWLEHEEYDPADNMNGRMVFPVTKDTVAPTISAIDGGIRILDTNYIAYYGIYADVQRTELIYETGVFAEERGVAEEYLTDLDTYFVTVADYGRNEAFYLVKNGKVYTVEADGFGHTTREVMGREYINWQTGNYEYAWHTFNPETPDVVTRVSDYEGMNQYASSGGGYDYISGVVADDGQAYVASGEYLFKFDPETYTTERVARFWNKDVPDQYLIYVHIRNLMKHPETGEIYAWAYMYNFDNLRGRHLAKVDVETGELIPVWAMRNDIGYAPIAYEWAATFVDANTVAIWAFNGYIWLVNFDDGTLIREINLGLTAPNGENQFGVNGTGGNMLYDEEQNVLYMFSTRLKYFGMDRNDTAGFLTLDLDTDEVTMHRLGSGAHLSMQGLFFLDELYPTEEDSCIYYYEVIAPTCTTEGFTRHICAECGKEYRDDYVPALGHDYEAVVTEPTCTELGYTTYTCRNCGDSYKTDYTAVTEHSYEAVVTEPTCDEMGYTTYTCADCGDSYNGDYTNPTGHSFGQWETVIAPTCTAKGQQKRVCACGETEYREIDMAAHDYETVVTAATCTEIGYTTYTCTVCGDSYTADYVAPTGHSFGEWETVKAATCTEKGQEKRTCACGETEYRDTDKLEHNFKETVTEPTCTEVGYTQYTCEDCGYSYVSDLVQAVGHNYDAVVTAPTCTEVGYTTHTCVECGDSYISELVQPTGHSYEAVVTEPTCTEEGYTTYTCHCGDSYIDDYTAPYCPSEQYTDITLGAWYHEAVDFAVENGLMNGMSETVFAPNANMTRTQLVTVLYRLAGKPSVAGLENPFTDVANDEWYTNAIIWAANEGIVTGMNATTFAPGANVTREQLVTILYRFNGETEVDETVLEDYADAANISDWAAEAFAWAVENGIITGMTETTLAPQGNATRAQIATILMRFVELGK